MPYFAHRGRASTALSLRGHGGSEGRERLRETRLSDYLDDVRRGLAVFTEPPIVIAHSLGGLLAQMSIGREPIRALALLASLPPEGLMLKSPRLVLTDPHLWLEAFSGVISSRLPLGMGCLSGSYSDELPRERVARYSRKMTTEAAESLDPILTPAAVEARP
jgi:pimeloyl-ACP methyl ester carboxylesterase